MFVADLVFLYGESLPACTHHIDKYYVGYQTLQYMEAGSVLLHIGDRRYDMQGAWFWSAYPGPRVRFHAANENGTWVHRYLAFKGPLVQRWERDGLFPVTPRPRTVKKSRDGERFDQMLRLSRSTQRREALAAIHILEGLLLELAEEPATPSQEPAWLSQALERLSVQPREPLDYSQLAADLQISESTLRRRFREAVGVSPHAYLLQARIAEARRLLGETDLPVKSIAQRLNYRDVYFFSRQFRQLSGVPPAVYRRSRQ